MSAKIRTPILSAVAFFWTVCALSVGYSAYVSSYPATATAGVTSLSAGEWNKMVTALQALDTNLSAFTVSWGNVGIGGTPTQAFEVKKTSAGSPLISKVANFSASAGTQARFDLATQTPNSYGIWSVTENGGGATIMELAAGNGISNGTYFTNWTTVDGAWLWTGPFVWRHWNTERVRISSSGNVGIGTNNPAWHLEVSASAPNGYVGVTNNNIAAGWVRWTWLNGASGSPLGAGKMCFETGGACRFNLDNSGNATATAFNGVSDSRLKTNVETVSGISAVNKLRGVEFDWKSWDGRSSGVIAQELEAVLPHLVATDSSPEKMRSVNYAGLSAYFIEAIKELKTKNDELEAGNANLKKRIEALEIIR